MSNRYVAVASLVVTLFLFNSLISTMISGDTNISHSPPYQLEDDGSPPFMTDSSNEEGNLSRGGFHIVTEEWWEYPKPFNVEIDDMDGDGIGNIYDEFPTDPALPTMNSKVSNCNISGVPCNTKVEGFFNSNKSTWRSDIATESRDIAIGDIDGDGDLDMAVGNRLDKTQVFLNENGQFSQTPFWESNTSGATTSLALGDLDKDGDLELIVGSENYYPNLTSTQPSINGSIQIYYNNNGNYSQTSQTTIANNAFSLSLGDIDNDGYLDLAADGAIFLNSNGIISSTSSWVENGQNPTWGDVNNDGFLDLALSTWAGGNWNSGQNKIYLNNGGTLGTSPYWTSSDSSDTKSQAWGDVDNDGDLDLAIGNYDLTQFGANYHSAVQVYLNSNGVLSQSADWSFDLGTTNSIAWADMDGDGDLDLITGNENRRNKIYTNIDGILSNETVWFSENSAITQAIDVGDINGDGFVDIIDVSYGPNEVIYNSGAILSTQASWDKSYSENSLQVDFSDIDNDGDLDLAIGNYAGVNELYLNFEGSYPQTPNWTSNDSLYTTQIEFGDLNNDGYMDFVVGNQFQPTQVFANTGGSFFSTASWESTCPCYNTQDISLGDIDGDGYLDIVEVLRSAGKRILFTSGNEQFINDWSDGSSSDLGDIDNDGDLDLIVGNMNEPNQIFLNSGGSFPSSPNWVSSDSRDTRSVTLVDIDGDDYLDLVVGNFGEKNQIFFNNFGVMSTTASWESYDSLQTTGLTAGDVDRDGDLDIAVANYGEENQIFFNNEGVISQFAKWTSLDSFESAGLAWGDVNNDGTLDLAIGSIGNPQIFHAIADSDHDWSPDSIDQMIFDPTQYSDFDTDGYGDSPTGITPDSCIGDWGDSWRDRWGCPDLDKDGQSDLFDDYMNKPSQWIDSDGDGLGDNWGDESLNLSRPAHWPGEWFENAYNSDPSVLDIDNDGYEDESLQTIGSLGPYDTCQFEFGTSRIDRTGCRDSDGDGYSDPDAQWTIEDGADQFPSYSSQWNDTDNDGFGDNPYPAYQGDDCPNEYGNSTRDLFGCQDEDGDGYSTANDFDDSNPTKWGEDSDNDGVADSEDAFPYDPSANADSDGDGIGDNTDACVDTFGTSLWTIEEIETQPEGLTSEVKITYLGCEDGDKDGFADVTDDCPLEGGISSINVWGCPDADGDGIQNLDDDCPTQVGDSSTNLVGCPDSDHDGIADIEDPLPLNGSGTTDDWDGDLHNNSVDAFPFDETQWADVDGDGLGDELNGRNPDPSPGDKDNDGRLDPSDLSIDEKGCLLHPEESKDDFPEDPLEWSDFDGDCIGDNADADDDNDGYTDDAEFLAGTSPFSATSKPVESFEVRFPGTTIGLGAWDLIGMVGGIPMAIWLLSGLLTRNSRTMNYETRLFEARSEKELEEVSTAYERSLLMRMIAPHQALRLERIRTNLEAKYNQKLSAGDSLDQTDMVSGEQPPTAQAGIIATDGYEWLQHGGFKWYRNPHKGWPWNRWK
jgi:hypothetical protein